VYGEAATDPAPGSGFSAGSSGTRDAVRQDEAMCGRQDNLKMKQAFRKGSCADREE